MSKMQRKNQAQVSADPPCHVGDEEYASLGGQGTQSGFIYQLRVIMLCMVRGLQNDLRFKLATEMKAAGCFDDLVLKYNKRDDDIGSTTRYRYLQVKYSRDESKKIDDESLFNGKEFKLIRYLESVCQIKNHPKLSEGELEDVVIFTNIDLDQAELEKKGIKLIPDGQPDPILDIKTTGNQNKRYKFENEVSSIVYRNLEPDAHKLARTLVEKVFNSEQLSCDSPLLKKYRGALTKEVISTDEGRFSNNFITNEKLSDGAKNFRVEFYFQVLQQKGFPQDYDHPEDIWKEVKNETIECSPSFASDFGLQNLEDLSTEITKLIQDADGTKVINIELPQRDTSNKRTNKASAPNIERNIVTLSKYVFAEETKDKGDIVQKEVQFLSGFLDDDVPEDVLKLRQSLKKKLGDKFVDLKEYRLNIKNYNTFVEDQMKLESEFPKSHVNSRDIRDFLNKLRLAVKQPNIDELGEILRIEVGKHCQLNRQESCFATESIEREMWDWFLKKGGSFLSDEYGIEFVNAITDKIKTIRISGLSLTHSNGLEEFGMDFRKEIPALTEFLNSNNHTALNVVETEGTLMAAIHVYRDVKKWSNSDDAYIFIRLNDFLESMTGDEVITAFKTPGCYNLLVIVCEQMTDQGRQKLGILCKDSQQRRKHDEYKMKKLVFVTSTELIFEDCNRITYEFGFNDLTDDSQINLLNKPLIYFQGEDFKMSLVELLGTPESTGMQNEFQNLRNAIDRRTIEKLIIEEGNVKIGPPLASLRAVKEYFIDRSFGRRVVIKMDVLKKMRTSDLYAVGHADHHSLKNLEMSENEQFICLNHGEEGQEFGALCEKHPERNIHWLMAGQGKLLRIRSNGKLDTLIDHRDYVADYICDHENCDVCHAAATSTFSIDDLANPNDGPVIISDIPGMGKTTILVHSAKKIKERSPRMWVNCIELNDCIDVFSEKRGRRNFVPNNISPIEFLVINLLKLETQLEKEILKILIQKPSGVALLLDGMDEVCPKYEGKITEVLKALNECDGIKLVISTRPHKLSSVEKTLKHFFHTIIPFSQYDRIQFLVKFWKKKSMLQDEEQLTARADTVLNEFPEAISDRMNEFTGVPLQTLMIAEVFDPGYDWKYTKIQKPRDLKLTSLYEMFLDKKHEIYWEEKMKNTMRTLACEEKAEESKETMRKELRLLAMHTLLDQRDPPSSHYLGKDIGEINELKNKVNGSRERTGIVVGIKNERAQFVHLTFMEYLAADYLIDNIRRSETMNPNLELWNFIMNEVLRNSEYSVIRAFLNDLLAISSENSDTDDFLWEPELSHFLGNYEYHEQIFYVAATEGNHEIIKFFIPLLARDNTSRQSLVNIRFTREALTMLHIVVSYAQLRKSLRSSDKNNLEIVQWLLEQGANTDATDCFGKTPMHTAAESGNLPVLKKLLNSRDADSKLDCSVNALNKRLQRLQYIAAKSENLEMLQWLVEKQGCVVDTSNKRAETLQHVAAKIGNLEMLQWLVEKQGCVVDTSNKRGETLQHVAAKIGNLEMLQWLVEKQGCVVDTSNKRGETLQHVAAKIGNLEMLQWLVEKQGCVVDTPNKNGKTLQHAAAYSENFEMRQWLVEKQGCV